MAIPYRSKPPEKLYRPLPDGSFIRDVDPGPDGKLQTVLPGAERVSLAEIAQRRANTPLKPKTPQRPCDAGLFGDSHQQKEMKL